jgi:DNA-nicking Smr family endonuclease
MSISDDDKKLFREAVENIKPQKSERYDDDDIEEEPLEHYNDPLEPTLVDVDAKLSYFNQTLPHKVRRQLQRGQFTIEGILDLHKCTVEEAREQVAAFLQQASNEGSRCAIIIHGKGLDAKAPILINKINQWLPQSQYVLAFCSCQAKHGGTGAVYVLLR